jgi:16S rRNA (cytidine1402-2'-O)-methyltransferase
MARTVTIHAKGHPNIRATHEKSFELAAEETITQAGKCIVGVSAAADTAALASLRGSIEITLVCNALQASVRARMNPLYLPGDALIVRRDQRAKGRTLAIAASHSSRDLDRALVTALQQPESTLEVVIQEVGEERGPGALFVVGTPIGHCEDLVPRAARVLRSVDVVACEDTRTSQPILNRLGVTARRVSYHDHNETGRADELAELLRAGARLALISDAGMPGIADPGYRIIRRAHEIGAIVSVIPGPCAALLGIVASGFPTDAFTFAGFLPRAAKERTEALRRYSMSSHAVVVYEAPHRLEDTLTAVAEIYADRSIAVMRELTKPNEHILRGRAEDLLQTLRDGHYLRGEITIVLSGSPTNALSTHDTVPPWLEPMCRALLEAGVSKSTIAVAIRQATGWPKRRGYAYVLTLTQGSSAPRLDGG